MSYKVKFDTGQTVEFDAMPSQQDIDEVAQKLNLQANQGEKPVDSPPQPENGLVSTLLNPKVGVEQAVKNLPSTLGQEFIGGAKSNISQIASTADSTFGGKTLLSDLLKKSYSSVVPENIKSKVNDFTKQNPNLTKVASDVYGAYEAPASTLVNKTESLMGKKPGTFTTPSNTAQKSGAAINTIAQLLAGSKVGQTTLESLFGKRNAATALSLSPQELGAVDKSKLSYLGTKGFDQFEQPLQGGILKPKSYAMTDEVKGLQDEFGDLLKSGDPQTNLQSAMSKMNELQSESKAAFEGANKSINQNTLFKGLQNSIKNMSDSVYEAMSKENQTAYTEKRIKDFLSYVKEGTLRGLDDALEAYRASNAKTSDASLSKANDAIYQAAKRYIIENLPAQNAERYAVANQKQARLFDVAEVLKGKIKSQVGDFSQTGKLLKFGGLGLGGYLSGKFLEHFIKKN